MAIDWPELLTYDFCPSASDDAFLHAQSLLSIYIFRNNTIFKVSSCFLRLPFRGRWWNRQNAGLFPPDGFYKRIGKLGYQETRKLYTFFWLVTSTKIAKTFLFFWTLNGFSCNECPHVLPLSILCGKINWLFSPNFILFYFFRGVWNTRNIGAEKRLNMTCPSKDLRLNSFAWGFTLLSSILFSLDGRGLLGLIWQQTNIIGAVERITVQIVHRIMCSLFWLSAIPTYPGLPYFPFMLLLIIKKARRKGRRQKVYDKDVQTFFFYHHHQIRMEKSICFHYSPHSPVQLWPNTGSRVSLLLDVKGLARVRAISIRDA